MLYRDNTAGLQHFDVSTDGLCTRAGVYTLPGFLLFLERARLCCSLSFAASTPYLSFSNARQWSAALQQAATLQHLSQPL